MCSENVVQPPNNLADQIVSSARVPDFHRAEEECTGDKNRLIQRNVASLFNAEASKGLGGRMKHSQVQFITWVYSRGSAIVERLHVHALDGH